jgi:hypothetical protein
MGGVGMGTIDLRTGAPDRARIVLRQALERERRLVADGISRTREKVTGLIEKTGIDPDALRMGRVPHPEDRDMELLELEGEMELLTALEEQLRVLEELEICP